MVNFTAVTTVLRERGDPGRTINIVFCLDLGSPIMYIKHFAKFYIFSNYMFETSPLSTE